MLTVKQIVEFAYGGALADYTNATKFCEDASMLKRSFDYVKETKEILDELSKKENYVTASNAADVETILRAVDLGSGQVKEFKTASQAQTHTVSSEYMVHLEIVNVPHRGPGISKKFYSTLEEANKEFLGWKTANENMNCYSVRLCEKIGEGKYKVLARSLPKRYVEPQAQQPKEVPQQFAPLYQVRITHLTGEEQVLRFPILDAAKAAFELLKYELKVKRIRGACIVKVIPSTGFKQTLTTIGVTEEEEDIF